jgi:hypothetical protein
MHCALAQNKVDVVLVSNLYTREWGKRGRYLYPTPPGLPGMVTMEIILTGQQFHGSTHSFQSKHVCVSRVEPSCCTFNKTNGTPPPTYHLLPIANIDNLRMFPSKNMAY